VRFGRIVQVVQVRSGYVRLDHVKSGFVMLVQVTLG